MADKCASCNGPIDIIFLEKISGTWLRDSKGKKHPICASCQASKSIDDLRKKL